MGGWNTNETIVKSSNWGPGTWAAFTSGAILATSQPACPDDLVLKHLTFPSKLLILSSLFYWWEHTGPERCTNLPKVIRLCQVSLTPKSISLHGISAATEGSVLHGPLPGVRLTTEKLPKTERQIHWVKLNSNQDHCLFQFRHFLLDGSWASHFPFLSIHFLIYQTGMRAPVLPL